MPEQLITKQGMITYSKLSKLARNSDAFLAKLLEWGILPKEKSCPKCNNAMRYMQETHSRDGWAWFCPAPLIKDKTKVCCAKRISIRKNTFFERSKCRLSQVVRIVHAWTQHIANSLIAEKVGVSLSTVTDFTSFCRKVVLDYCFTSPKMIGGPGKIVTIDEFIVERIVRNYKRDHYMNQMVFGGIEYGSGDFFMIPVDRRDTATFLRIIENWISPGTTIVSDASETYSSLSTVDHEHLSKKNLLVLDDHKSGANHNSLEGIWQNATHCMPYLKTTEDIKAYVGQFMFENRCKRADIDPLIEFFKEADAVYSATEVKLKDENEVDVCNESSQDWNLSPELVDISSTATCDLIDKKNAQKVEEKTPRQDCKPSPESRSISPATVPAYIATRVSFLDTLIQSQENIVRDLKSQLDAAIQMLSTLKAERNTAIHVDAGSKNFFNKTIIRRSVDNERIKNNFAPHSKTEETPPDVIDVIVTGSTVPVAVGTSEVPTEVGDTKPKKKIRKESIPKTDDLLTETEKMPMALINVPVNRCPRAVVRIPRWKRKVGGTERKRITNKTSKETENRPMDVIDVHTTGPVLSLVRETLKWKRKIELTDPEAKKQKKAVPSDTAKNAQTEKHHNVARRLKEINIIVDEHDSTCACQQVSHGQMITCNNPNCPIEWLSPSEIDVDSYERKYCICQQVACGEMIECDNANCSIELFHLSCVGLKFVPGDGWFCPTCKI